MKRGRKNKFNVSTCICPECGNRMYVPRSQSMARKKKHIKDLWCPYCKEVKKMREIRDRDFIY